MKFDKNYTENTYDYKYETKPTKIELDKNNKVELPVIQIKTKIKEKRNLHGIIQENTPKSINDLIREYDSEQLKEISKPGIYTGDKLITPETIQADAEKIKKANQEYKNRKQREKGDKEGNKIKQQQTKENEKSNTTNPTTNK